MELSLHLCFLIQPTNQQEAYRGKRKGSLRHTQAHKYNRKVRNLNLFVTNVSLRVACDANGLIPSPI